MNWEFITYHILRSQKGEGAKIREGALIRGNIVLVIPYQNIIGDEIILLFSGMNFASWMLSHYDFLSQKSSLSLLMLAKLKSTYFLEL